MVERLNFPDLDTAKRVRDEYFERYHATAKALTVAEQGEFSKAARTHAQREIDVELGMHDYLNTGS